MYEHTFFVYLTDDEADFPCNRTLQMSPGQETPLTVTSPAYPASYPDNIVCITMIESVPGYRIVLSFDEFVLEESPKYYFFSFTYTYRLLLTLLFYVPNIHIHMYVYVKNQFWKKEVCM